MKKINLRELYPDAYTTDFFVNVTEDVLETIRASERAEAAYERKMYRYKAQYSLDCENGIENTVLTKPQTPEMVLEEKQLQKQVYFRHSYCLFSLHIRLRILITVDDNRIICLSYLNFFSCSDSFFGQNKW